MPPEPVVLVVTALRKGTESQDFLIQYIYVLYSTYSTVHTVQYTSSPVYLNDKRVLYDMQSSTFVQ